MFMNPFQQFQHAQGMARQVNTAISQEMQSRVEQVREARRLQHERELEQIRANAMLQAKDKEQEGQLVRQLLADM